MVKVVINNGQYKVTIPKDLAESKDWHAGTKITFIESPDGRIMLKEITKER